MPAVTRIGDLADGSCGCSPTPAASGSPNVFVNTIPVVRNTDTYVPHCTHTPVAVVGSPNVFVNTLPVHRISDVNNCGNVVIVGSPNVFANS